jgi:SAM-dependent methyltransferase
VPLNAERARRAYDRIGRLQDTQVFYEHAVTRRLAELGRFEQARWAFELGCGTGRFAAQLLRDRLPVTARYRGVEISPKMAALARRQLAQWVPRAEVVLVEPPGRVLPGCDGQFDRFVACYLFDLLAYNHAGTVLNEAGRLLAPNGLLCLVSLTRGATRTGRMVSDAWDSVSERWPLLLGGCRSIELAMLLEPGAWHIKHQEVLTRWGVSSQLLVASPAEPAGRRSITNPAVSRSTTGGEHGPAPRSFPLSVTPVSERQGDYAHWGPTQRGRQ